MKDLLFINPTAISQYHDRFNNNMTYIYIFKYTY